MRSGSAIVRTLKVGALLLATPNLAGAQEAVRELGSLEVGAPRADTIAPGERHRLVMTLAEGEWVEILVHQLEVDLVVRVFRPEGELDAEVDGPGVGEPETLRWIAGVAGDWTVEVTPYAVDHQGAYSVTWETRREASAEDVENWQARRMQQEAFALYTQRRFADAEPLLIEAVERLSAVLGPDHPDVALTLTVLGLSYHVTGRLTEAEPHYLRALGIRERTLGGDHPEVAQSVNNLAALYMYQGRYTEAEPLYLRSLADTERALGPAHLQLSIRLNNLGELYRILGRHVEAEQAFRRALDIRLASSESPLQDVAASQNALAQILAERAQYAEALTLFRMSLENSERALGPDHPELSYALGNLASLHARLGRHAEVESLYLRAVAVSEAVPGPGLAIALSKLGDAYREQGRYAEALALQRRALAIEEEARGPDHVEVATLLSKLASIGLLTGETGDVESQLLRTLSIRERALGPDHPLVGVTHAYLGAAQRDLGRTAEARASLDRAIEVLEGATSHRESVVTARDWRARLLWTLGDRQAALADLTRAIERVEELRPSAGGDEETRATFLATQAGLYGRMVEWQVASGDAAEALRHAERGSARAFQEQLAAAGVDVRDGIAPERRAALEAREREALTALASYQQRITLTRVEPGLSDGERGARLAALGDSLRTADTEYRRVYTEIKDASPVLGDIVSAGGDPVPVEALQREVVPQDGYLLRYQVGEGSSHLFVIPPEGELEVVELSVGADAAGALGAEAGPLTGELAHALLLAEDAPAGLAGTRGAGVRQRRGGAGSAAHLALRRVLLPDEVWDRVRDAGEVVVIPDGALHYLPFDALVTSLDDEGSPRYWLDEGPVVRYAASGTVLYNLERRARGGAATRGILSLSDPIYDPLEVGAAAPAGAAAETTAQVTRAEFERAGALQRLPGTARESDALRDLFGDDPQRGGVTVLRGPDAGEPELRAEIGRHRYVHLATHGLVDQARSAMFASLALTPPAGAAAPDDDGFLHLHEIYGLPLDGVELAVLSACESNVGEDFVGEGVFALSRGFLVAGARRVLASQWSVDDASTAVLIESFFRAIAETTEAGGTVDYAGALRAAQLRVRNDPDHPEWADPYYWAPFVLTGSR